MPQAQRTVGGAHRHGFCQCLARSKRFGWSVSMLIFGVDAIDTDRCVILIAQRFPTTFTGGCDLM